MGGAGLHHRHLQPPRRRAPRRLGQAGTTPPSAEAVEAAQNRIVDWRNLSNRYVQLPTVKTMLRAGPRRRRLAQPDAAAGRTDRGPAPGRPRLDGQAGLKAATMDRHLPRDHAAPAEADRDRHRRRRPPGRLGRRRGPGARHRPAGHGGDGRPARSPGEVRVFDGVAPEPKDSDLAAALDARAPGAAGPRRGSRRRLGHGRGQARRRPLGQRPVARRTSPARTASPAAAHALAQVATTAGTGSEGGIRALVTDTAHRHPRSPSKARTCSPTSPSSTPSSP